MTGELLSADSEVHMHGVAITSSRLVKRYGDVTALAGAVAVGTRAHPGRRLPGVGRRLRRATPSLPATRMAGVGFAVGFRIHTSVPAFLAALGLVLVLGYALPWGAVVLGLVIGGPPAGHVTAALVWIAGMLVAFVAVATARVRRGAA